MPELEQLIAQWRRGLAESAGCSKEVLDELESHLRDEIQQLVRSGHSEEQALTLAASRLGSPHTLAAEFAKNSGPASWLPVRVLRMVFLGVVLATLLLGYFLARGQNGRVGLLLATHVCAILLGYSASLFVGVLAICYVARRPFGDLNLGQMRSVGRTVFMLTSVAAVLTLAGILTGCVWAKDHLGHYWGWDPKETWAAAVLIWDVAILLLLRYGTSERTVIRLGVLGNVLVGFAWFAGAPHLLYLLIIFAAIHIALFGMGFVPPGSLRSRSA
jgi:hypothetical protein